MAAYSTTLLSSVTRHGITWNFTEPRPCWQFPNGDWGVQRPVTIASYTPAPAILEGIYAVNGAMINPIPGTSNYAGATQQGFCSSASTEPSTGIVYDPALNCGLTLPYTLPTDASLCNGIEHLSVYYPEQTYFSEFAVLTCLATVPEEGSFRPPYAGTNKSIHAAWNVNTLIYSALKNDPMPESAPADWPDLDALAYLEEATERTLLDIAGRSSASFNTGFKAAWDSPRIGSYPRRAYGAQEIAPIANNAAIALNADFTDAQKETLLVHMVQWGIDNYGIDQAGGGWNSNGGHSCGRKIVTTIAAAVTGDALMLASLDGSRGVYNEDLTHFFVTQDDIDTPRRLVGYDGAVGSNPPFVGTPERLLAYTQDQLGMADWSFNLWDLTNRTPQMSVGDGSNGSVWFGYNFGYRATNAGADIPAVYIYQRMGLREVMNNEPMFRYVFDRAVPYYLGGFGETIIALWEAHMLATGSCILSLPDGIYELGRTLSVSSGSPGAIIRMATGGAIPDSDSDAVSGPLVLSSSGVTKFVAFVNGLPPSGPTTFTCTILTDGTPAPPRITP